MVKVKKINFGGILSVPVIRFIKSSFWFLISLKYISDSPFVKTPCFLMLRLYSDHLKNYKKLQKFVPLAPTSYCRYIFLKFEFSRRIKNLITSIITISVPRFLVNFKIVVVATEIFIL